MRYKWDYWVFVSAAFLYDRYAAASRMVLVSLRHSDRDIRQAIACVSDVGLSICVVILRYKAVGLSGGCEYGAPLYVPETRFLRPSMNNDSGV